MDLLVIFIAAYVGWHGIDAIYNKRMIFGPFARLHKGKSAIFKGSLAVILSLLLLTYALDSFADARLSSIVVFVVGVITSYSVSKWLYSTKTR